MNEKTFEQAAEEVRDVMEAAYEEHDRLFLEGAFTYRPDRGDYELTGEEKNTYYELDLEQPVSGIHQDEDGTIWLNSDVYCEDRSEYYHGKGYEFIRENYPEMDEGELMQAALELGWKY